MAGGGKKEQKAGKDARKAEKKARKAAKKARKEEKRAAKRAAKEAARLARQAGAEAPVPAAPSGKRARVRRAAPSRAAAVTRKKPVRKKATRRTAARLAPAPSAPPAPALKDRQQPESLRLRSAGPSFTVNDIQHSLVFYRDVLGFTVKERWEENGELRGVELVAGAVSFWLGQDDWKKGRDRVKGQGFRVYCGTTQDVDAIAARVRAAGLALLEEPNDQPWGGRDFAVVDPDGFTISIARGL